MSEEVKPIFRGLTADDPDLEATQIESLCMDCGDNGITKLLLTKIPYYKEVVLMSFACEHCGFRNNELQSGSKIEDKGLTITLQVKQLSDLNRQVVKSDYTEVKIPDLLFEIPAQSQKGEVTTLEGILERAIQGLEQDQIVRWIQDPHGAQQIDEFVEKFKKLKLVETPFTVVLSDISGNCHIENLCAPQKDPALEIHSFTRNKSQDRLLGIYDEESQSTGSDSGIPASDPFTLEDLHGEILKFGTNCPDCNSPCDTNMKMTNIPYFKDVVIMATNCEACGARTNEVKSGGGIENTGCRMKIKITNIEDLSRDVLKSDTCSLEVPELELEVGGHALGGRFTTVEGILAAMKNQLLSHHSNWGDSASSESKLRYDKFLESMDKAMSAELPVTLILDDPAGNSYIQKLSDDDPHLTVERYERSHDQNECLGINDLQTENYHELEQVKEEEETS